MNKLTIPAILAATVMVAGMFAFMPVQQASTVHTTGTMTLGADSITAARIATDAIGAAEIATDAIGAAEIATSAVTEIQSNQIIIADDNTLFGSSIVCTVTDASFLVHYNVAGFADTENLTITGTATADDLVYIAQVAAANHGIVGITGTVGGNAGETVIFFASADTTIVGHFVLETAAGAAGAACA